MDIRSGSSWPSSSLSNFSPHPFIIDEIPCNSMEGFLQSLKFKNPEIQKEVCKLVGKKAKFRGAKKKWWRNQVLWWKGESIYRNSIAYQDLLDRAYEALSKNNSFQKALLATRDAPLRHSLGKNDPRRTVLTVREFCGRLMRIRKKLKEI